MLSLYSVKQKDLFSGQKKLPVTEIKPKTLNFSNGCPVITDKYLDYRKIGNLDGRYAISVGQNIEKQTAGEMLEALSYNPVGFDMEKLGLVYSISTDMELSDIADFTGFSPSYFSRIFKQITGSNFVEYMVKKYPDYKITWKNT